MSLSGLAQFILGFILGVFILTGTGAAAAYFFLNRLSNNPPKPVYTEEEETTTNTEENSSASSSESSSPQATTSPPPEPEKPKTIQERFGEQAYEARVTWSSGLSLRESPTLDGTRVGGVYYNDRVIVIERSGDGDWQKIYIPESGQQAWVKAGNVEKVN